MWPDLIKDIKDPSPRLQIWLPPNTYQRVFEINRGSEDLLSVSMIDFPGTREEWNEELKLYSNHLTVLSQKAEQLEDELREEYKKTFS